MYISYDRGGNIDDPPAGLWSIVGLRQKHRNRKPRTNCGLEITKEKDRARYKAENRNSRTEI